MNSVNNNQDISFLQKDETHLIIQTSDYGIDQELSDYFSFFVDGYKFSPKFRSGQWDGKIRLYDVRYKKLPKGLLKVAIKFCKDRNYTFHIDPSLNPKTYLNEQEIIDWIDSIEVSTRGKQIDVRDYQLDAILQSLRYFRNLLISPTSSGKSLILYYKVRHHIDILQHNIVLIVPTTQLVEQLYSDFKDYSENNGWDVDEYTQLLYSGKEKLFTKQLMISTWQSLAAMSKFHPDKFKHICETTDALCLDECLDGDTLITMADGQKKKIKNLNKGEIVISRNEKTGNLENKPIVKVHKNITPSHEKMFRVKMTDGQEIDITGNHKVFLECGEWKRVDELQVGDIINSL